MKWNNPYFRIVFYIVFYILLSVFTKSSQQTIRKLDLYEGDICRKGNGSEPNYECRRAENCHSIEEQFKTQNYPDICMFDRNQPIFCCLPNDTEIDKTNRPLVKRLSFTDYKCRQYGDMFKKMFACDSQNEFTCLDGQCISTVSVCDGYSNCRDGYDENDSVCQTWTCDKDYFKCSNNKCILDYKVCDGSIQCTDGSDEHTSTCETWSCSEDYFKCGTNKCIYRNLMCDGKNDCQDGSDEDATMCKARSCREDEFKCSSGYCIWDGLACNGIIDCMDESDENSTVCKARNCKENEFKCFSGQCIWDDLVCNGEIDCIDESDENASLCKTWNCHDDYFKCGTNKCIYRSLMCNEKSDCQDESDEDLTMCKTRSCRENEFKCSSGYCIWDNLVCNGNIDCIDGSDEDSTICKNWKRKEQTYSPVASYAFNGIKTQPREFKHMAILGFGQTINKTKWACGGSLISEKWVLSAAHCQKLGIDQMVNWVRLGDLNIVSTTDDARPTDYRIAERVIHPEYKTISHYNDIALFRLEKDVQFSEYIWPICLNSNPSVDPTMQLIATGWGRTSDDGPTSDDLLKVKLYSFSAKQCNDSYFSTKNRKLKYGITPDSIICAGSPLTGEDTCVGDSGGPLQVKNNDFTNMYTQVGITSFGKFCGDKNTPGVYSRVSKYISWIEEIVWPVN